MSRVTWLADVLRSADLNVVEENGWKTRGRDSFGPVKGVICHHTAGSKSGNSPSLKVVRDGRKGLAGPLSHLFLARDGTFHVVAAGRANHAGKGVWQGITTGNTSFIGIEAENTGLANDMPWPTIQMEAYTKGVAAILEKIKQPAIMCCGHKEYSTPKGRKIDPTFDMDSFRLTVASVLDHATITGKSYTVKTGDTPYGIAKRFGMKLETLLSLNKLTLGSVIHPGDKFLVT